MPAANSSGVSCLTRAKIHRSIRVRRVRRFEAGSVEALEPRAYLSAAVSLTFSSAISSPIGITPISARVADFNLDGKFDLMLETTAGNALSLMLGNGDGTFQAPIAVPTPFSPTLFLAPDFNDDGKPDLLVADAVHAINLQVMLGNGDGTFSAPIDTGLTNGVPALGDFNGDGKADLATTNRTKAVHLALGNGDGTFNVRPDLPLPDTALGVIASNPKGEGANELLVGLPDATAEARKFFDMFDNPNEPSVKVEPTHISTREFWDAVNDTDDGYEADFRGLQSVLGPEPDDLRLQPDPSEGFVEIPTNDPDAFVSSNDSNGDPGTFRDAGSLGITGTVTTITALSADFNHDNLNDIVYLSRGEHTIRVLPRQTQAKFGKAQVLASISGNGLNAVNIGDFNNDAIADVVVSDGVTNTMDVYLSTASAAPTQPSLAPSIPSTLPESLIAGEKEKATIVVNVTNNGSTTSSGRSTVQLFASTDETLDGADQQLATMTKTLKIKAAKVAPVKFSLAGVPSGLAAGNYHVIAKVTDSTGTVTTTATTTIFSAVAPFVDLVAGAVTGPTKVTPGKKISATVAVTNSGNVLASGSVSIAFGARPEGTAGEADVPLASVPSKVKIQPTKTARLKLKVLGPSTLTSGSYSLVAALNPTGTFAESDLTNNIGVAAIPFTVA